MPTEVRNNPHSKHKALPMDSCSVQSSDDESDDDSDNGKQKQMHVDVIGTFHRQEER